MATFTRRELIDQTAFKLGALSVGQTLSAEDLAALDGMAGSLFDQLAEDGILMVADDDAIPASWCLYLAILLANLAGPDYGAAMSPDVKVVNEAILRRLVRGTETYEPQTPDYF